MPSPLAQLILLIPFTVIVGLAFNLVEYRRLRVLDFVKSIAFSRHWPAAIFYLCTYAVAAAAITVAIFSESLFVRCIALLAVFLSLAADLSCRFVQGANVCYNEINITLTESTFAGQFLSAHSTSILKAILQAAIFTAALLIATLWPAVRFDLWWLLLIPLAILLAYSVIWKTVAATDVYPAPIRIVTLAIYALLNPIKTGPRKPASIKPTSSEQPRIILFIMDESITGSYLSINGYHKNTLPLLSSIADQYLNLGIACSASNISAATNVIARSGLRADQLPDRSQAGLSQSNIFQYAKQAGYRTVYLDGQYAPGVRGNLLTPFDLQTIDDMYWVIGDEPDPLKRHRRDRLMAQRILDHIKSDEPTFIWINKYGAHFHFEYTYPDEARIFTPTMPINKSISACTPEEIENSYANALRWSVDGFFEILLPAVDHDHMAILYTSDHGQSIEGAHGASTHADSIDPPAVQANVPMLLWGQHLLNRFPNGIDHLRDRTSHFQLFPTALTLMGYDETEVTRLYGTPLWGPPPQSRVFLSGDIFGRGIARLNDFQKDGPVFSRATAPEATASVS